MASHPTGRALTASDPPGAGPSASLVDPRTLAQAFAAAGGPRCEILGDVVGRTGRSWSVDAAGAERVLSWVPARVVAEHDGDLTRPLRIVDRVRHAGVPAPRWEHARVLPDGSGAVLEEPASGVPVSEISGRLISSVLELVDARREALADTDLGDEPTPLHLSTPGHGFCEHETLADFSDETRLLLERIESIGTNGRDELSGTDAVHFDEHLGNVLVDPEHPDQVTSVVGWAASRGGRTTLDLVVLTFDLSLRAPELAAGVEHQARSSSDDEVFLECWAHVGLRTIDNAIRFDPSTVEHFVDVAQRYLGAGNL